MTNVFDKIFKSNIEMAGGMGPPLPPSPSVSAMELANRMYSHQNAAAAAQMNQAQQGGWAATNVPQGQTAEPVDLLINNPFQAASLYIRLRMTQRQLKEKDIEIAFVRQMGGCVHVAIVNQDRLLTMIDEDAGAFPSDAFVARIRLLL